ncbi:MAG TPA: DUF2075 domain-containing protein [Desulfobacteraceae bacterium]|nr:DUF2075 domain-containing protein [Desulfobacteraceae bacterium]
MTYLEHFRLNEKPFDPSPDPRFMWLGEAHRKAWATLHFGVLNRRGFILLIGDVGTGKTTVINKLVQELDENTLVARICDPGLNQLDFYKFLASQLGLKGDFRTKGDFLIELHLFLHRAHRHGKNVAVIVDEAQRLSDELLEEIRLLSNVELPNKKLINIVLVGQNELREKLAKNSNRALRQRITSFYTLGPLDPSETEDVIRHRLKVAGAEDHIFTPPAIRMIAAYSRGNPRLMNLICDQALAMAFVQKKHRVDEVITEQCVKRLTYMLAPAVKQDQDTVIKKGAPASVSDKPRPTQENNDSQRELANPPTPPPSPRSRHPALLAGAAVGVFVLMVLVTAHLYRPQRSDRFVVGQAPPQRVHPQQVLPPDQTGNAGAQASSPTFSETMPVQPNNATPATPPADLREAEQDPAVPVASARESAPEDGAKPTGSGEAIPGTDGVARPDAPPAETAPSHAKALPAEKTVIRFPYNSNQISDEAFGKLDQLAEMIKRRPGTRLVITGYTDGLGNRAYNINVSKLRADAIKSYFIGQGISADRITATGLGPANPVAPDDTFYGRSQNRRVEIEIIAAD